MSLFLDDFLLKTKFESFGHLLGNQETHLDEYGIVPLHGSGTTNTKNWRLGETLKRGQTVWVLDPFFLGFSRLLSSIRWTSSQKRF